MFHMRVKPYGIYLFSDRAISLRKIPFSSIYVDVKGKPPSFLKAKEHSFVHGGHIFSVHSSVEGRLGSFPHLAIVDAAAVDTGLQGPFAPLRLYLRETLLVQQAQLLETRMVVDGGHHSSVQAHSVCNSQREPYPRGSLIMRNVPAAAAADG